jgi:hypothetical protein
MREPVLPNATRASDGTGEGIFYMSKMKFINKSRPMWAILNYGRLMTVQFTREDAIKDIFGPVIEGERHCWKDFIRNPDNAIIRVNLVLARRTTARPAHGGGAS